MLGAIFFKAQNKIQDPAKLSRLVQLIDAEDWISLDADTKGDLYEGLLRRNAEGTMSGAGRYFTLRPLIQAMVACLRPEPLRTIADPACGTGGFFLGAYARLTRGGQTLDRRQKEFLRRDAAVRGQRRRAYPPQAVGDSRTARSTTWTTCRRRRSCSRRSSSIWRPPCWRFATWPPGWPSDHERWWMRRA
ncbi:N-6 DNA methylase [uncultured Thiodictyon sp.]|uniref:N-6 DNA methylase n=1 Tax=uncultured Thiodictyon sp. TaxID=1846217 RepID=UPI0025E9D344|nr:N-6 DNA methylase [uncultured Thiodictyon sp.]